MEAITIRFLANGKRRYTDPFAYKKRCLYKQRGDFVHELNIEIIVEALAYYTPATTKLKTIECWNRDQFKYNALKYQAGKSCLVRWTTLNKEINCPYFEKQGTIKIDHDLIPVWEKFRNPSNHLDHGYISFWTARQNLQSPSLENHCEQDLKICIEKRDAQQKRERDPA